MELDIKELARKGLLAELTRLDAARAKVMALLAELGAESATAVSKPVRRPRKMSAEGRERIREAVRRRWERVRADQSPSSAADPPDAAATAVVVAAKVAKVPARTRAASRKPAGNRKK